MYLNIAIFLIEKIQKISYPIYPTYFLKHFVLSHRVIKTIENKIVEQRFIIKDL